MARGAVDISNLQSAFGAPIYQFNLMAERRRAQEAADRARRDRQTSSLLTALGSAVGFAIGGPLGSAAVGTLLGGAAGSLLGPEPDPGRAVNLGLSALMESTRETKERKTESLLDKFSQNLSPPPVAIPGEADVYQPPPDRAGAAAAAARLGDIGTAANLAFPSGKSESREPLFNVTLNPEGKPSQDYSGVPYNALPLLARQAGGYERMEVFSVGPRPKEGVERKEEYYRATITSPEIPGESNAAIEERTVGNAEIPALLKQYGPQNVQLYKVGTEKEGGEAKQLPAHRTVNLSNDYIDAVNTVAKTSGRQDILDAIAKSPGKLDVQTLQLIGSLDADEVQTQYKKFLEDEIKSSKPEQEKNVARGELARVNAKIDEKQTLVGQAKAAYSKAQKEGKPEAAKKILEEAGRRGLTRKDLGL